MTPVKKDHLALSIALKQKLIRAIRKYCILPEHSKTSYPSGGNHLFPSPPPPLLPLGSMLKASTSASTLDVGTKGENQNSIKMNEP